MAERRMFAKTIIDSDMFLDMPLSTQALYFHLSMRADDEGFINNPKKIQRMIGSSDDDLKVLIAKKFIIPFDSGIVVIRHWRVHNYIKKDRMKETIYQFEKSMLFLNESNEYDECIQTGSSLVPNCIQTGSSLDTQDRLGKGRLGKGRLAEEDARGRAHEAAAPAVPGLSDCVREYEANIGTISAYVGECIKQHLDSGLEAELVIEAIHEAAANNARNWKYIDSILIRCLKEKILTVQAFRTAKEKPKQKETSSEQLQRCLEELQQGVW